MEQDSTITKGKVVPVKSDNTGKITNLITTKANIKVTESGLNDIHNERKDLLEAKGVQVEMGGHSKEFFSSNDFVVISPGVDPKSIPYLNELTCPIVSALELGATDIENKFIAVTGTNGKSTTCP